MDDSGANVVLGVGVDPFEEREAEADELRLDLGPLHRMVRLKNLLRLLAGAGNEILEMWKCLLTMLENKH